MINDMTLPRYVARFSALLFILFCPLISDAVIIEGRVFSESGPLQGAVVSVYKNYNDIETGAFFLRSGAADEQGLYKLDLPGGEYYFVARGAMDGKEFFSYHGSNPIRVETENIWLPLPAHELKMPVYSDGSASMRGVITYNGKPVKNVYISLYEPGDKSFRGLGFMTERIEDGGAFNFPLPPNKYVVIAKKMEGDNMIRPLRSGDLYCYYPRNPVEVKPGKVLNIEVPCGLKGEKAPNSGPSASRANNYLTVDKLRDTGKFGIKGKITDSDAKPVQGVYVIALKGDPFNDFVSYRDVQGKENISRTDSNGDYFIHLESDGFYRIVARNQLGARTGEKEFFMLYEGNAKHGFDFRKGQVIDNVDMVIKKMAKEDPGGAAVSNKKEGGSK